MKYALVGLALLATPAHAQNLVIQHQLDDILGQLRDMQLQQGWDYIDRLRDEADRLRALAIELQPLPPLPMPAPQPSPWDIYDPSRDLIPLPDTK